MDGRGPMLAPVAGRVGYGDMALCLPILMGLLVLYF